MLARQRAQAARAARVKDQKMGPQDGLKAEIDGMGAEMAFAKHFNCYPDLSIGARSGGFDAYFQHKNGKRITVDVKHSPYSNARLLATRKKTLKDADCYVLVTGECPNYTLVGYAYADELIRPENIKDLGHGAGYVLPREKLHEFKE